MTPESFLRAMADFEAGRFVPMETALYTVFTIKDDGRPENNPDNP
jgi:hypothetical protein